MMASDADGGSCGTVLYINRLRYRAMVACLSSIHSMGICAPAHAGSCSPVASADSPILHFKTAHAKAQALRHNQRARCTCRR